MKDYLVKKGIQGSIYNYAGKIGFSLFNFLILVYVVRQLSVENFGIYNLLINILTVGLIFTGVGLPQTLERFVPEFRSGESRNKIKKIFSAGLLLRICLGVMFVLVLNLFTTQIGSFFNFTESLYRLIPIFSVVILFHIENQLIGDSFLLANLRHKYWNTARIIYGGIKFGLFLFVLYRGLGLFWIVVAWSFAEFVLFMLYFVKTFRWFSLKAIDFSVFDKRVFSFMAVSFLIVIGTITRQITVDNFLISRYLGVKEVGLYSFVFGIPLILLKWSPAKMLKNLFLPIFIRKYTENKSKKSLEKMFTFYNKVIFFATLPMFAGVSLLSRPIIRIVFDPQYLKVNYLFNIALVFIFFRSFIYPFEVILRTTEKINIILYATFFTVYNIVVGIILISKLGIVGAVIASGTTGLLILAYYKITVQRFIETGYHFKSLAKVALNTAVMGVFLYSVEGYVKNMWHLMGAVVLGALVYLMSSYINKCFSPEERDILNNSIGRKVFIF